MSYLERLVASPLVAVLGADNDRGRELRIVPDACVDLIWSGEGLRIAGPDTKARVVTLAPGAWRVGVRLRPGVAGAVLRVPASELCDCTAEAAEVLGHDVAAPLLEALAAGRGPARAAAAGHAGAGRARSPIRWSAAVAALGRPRARVSAVAEELGVSVRQLQRLVSAAAGYGPKLLARVLRFRRLQALAPAPLVELALEAGYADQAHMTAEVTLLAGLSPVRFLKDRSPTAA